MNYIDLTDLIFLTGNKIVDTQNDGHYLNKYTEMLIKSFHLEKHKKDKGYELIGKNIRFIFGVPMGSTTIRYVIMELYNNPETQIVIVNRDYNLQPFEFYTTKENLKVIIDEITRRIEKNEVM